MKTILRLLLVLLILTIALVTFLLTPMGLRFGIPFATQWINGELHYKKISGVIIGPIVVNDLYYKNKNETILIKKLEFNWQPLDLFKREFRISSLQVNGLTLTTKKHLTPNKWDMQSAQTVIAHITAFFEKASLFHTIIDHAAIFNMTVNDADNPTPLKIEKFLLHSQLTKNKWDMQFFAKITNPHTFDVQFEMTGKPTQYHTQLDIIGYQTHFSLLGDGNQNDIRLVTKNNVLLNGTVQLQLHIQWKPTITWNITLNTQKINTALIDPLWQSPMSIHVISTGTLGDDKKNLITDTDASLQIPNIKLHLTVAHKNKWHMQWHVQRQAQPNEPLTFDGLITGNFHDQQWQGDVQQLKATMQHNTAWILQKPTQIVASATTLTLSPLCMIHNNTDRVCLQGHIVNQHIVATLTTHINHLQWLTGIIPNVKIPTGQMTSNLQIGGTLNQPSVTGTLNFNQGSIFIPAINITLNNISASVVGKNSIIDFTVQAFSRKQPITASGSVDLLNPTLPIKIHLTSTQALIVDTEEYSGYATSDLMVNADIPNKKLVVTGNATVTKGTIQPQDFLNTHTLPDSDIVYIGNIVHKQKNPWEIYCDIKTTVGDQVHIAVAGFSANITGSLELSHQPNQDLFATGVIFTHHGSYNIYGQTLTIEHGSYITYTKSELNNPTLSIRASKIISEINNGTGGFGQNKLMVGIEMHGTVKSPNLTFYSNQSDLSQADILSYILLGYATAKSNTPGNTDFLLRALAAVKMTSQGLLGKQNLATQIQQGLGLNEMGVESETIVDSTGNALSRQSSFVVGKSLSRNFYARYSIGILDPVNVFQLRYVMNHHWALQTDSSSLGNGGDILYTITQK